MARQFMSCLGLNENLEHHKQFTIQIRRMDKESLKPDAASCRMLDAENGIRVFTESVLTTH